MTGDIPRTANGEVDLIAALRQAVESARQQRERQRSEWLAANVADAVITEDEDE